ncbi:hypothetical protein L249_8374 [Ophiocordyceps polyrhachis-furcata BCC 54312]|uniref:Uncharacterized protein n=1 Tax=Ophiocordyceps polyrhachis-furcata BCC 54312 TaxID=1330021 RepID=A0A367KYW1_9HYPO|nr:hypothetical protein L249_8374 [Ophiocordyceps polyrhachis-furcata BCC 54312]
MILHVNEHCLFLVAMCTYDFLSVSPKKRGSRKATVCPVSHIVDPTDWNLLIYQGFTFFFFLLAPVTVTGQGRRRTLVAGDSGQVRNLVERRKHR